MSKKLSLLVVFALFIIGAVPAVHGQDAKKLTIAFVPGVVDPFYQTMEVGIRQAAADFGVDVIVQVPQKFDPTVQTPIIQAVAAQKPDALITAATDKEQMVPVLQEVSDSGIPVISVDTFIGDGDYANGPVKFPLSYIGSDNELGGKIGCEALAEAIGKKGKVYIQNVKPGISTTDQREKGCKDALAEYPDVTLVGVDYNEDDSSKSQAQTAAVLARETDLAGVFGTNIFSARGAAAAVNNAGLKGAVKVAYFDADSEGVKLLQDGSISILIAQKPYDMGYTAVGYAIAYLNGVTSLPKRVGTGYAVATPDNMTDPEITRFFYSAEVGQPKAPIENFTVGFVPGVVDPFYHNMEIGVNDAAKLLGIKVITQIPQKFDPTVQTPIIQAVAAQKPNALITAATDKEQMVPVLEEVFNSGISVISVDTYIGDGDYANGPVKFPLSYIGSDNELGGKIGCEALAEAIGKKGKVYIQNVKPGISTTDQREKGCKDALAEYPDITLVGVDYNEDDSSKAQAQTAAVLARETDLAGVFGTNIFSARGAAAAVNNAGLKGAVKVAYFDADSEGVKLLQDGSISILIAQKPYDMGFLATFYAMANARGVASIPARIGTGYSVATPDNMNDPDVTKFFYK